MVSGRGLDLSLRFRPVELALLAYLGGTTVVAAMRIADQPACRWVLGTNILIAFILALLPALSSAPSAQRLRDLAPFLVLPALYSQIDLLNRFGLTPVHDPVVQYWEVTIFGGQVSRMWWQAHPSVFWSTLLHGAYIAFYPVVIAPTAFLLWSGDPVGARRAVSWVIIAFLLCYLGFILFPVAGPYYAFPRPDPAFLNNPTARLVYATLARGSSYGAAFPSSHVAAAIAATAAAYATSRRLGLILSLPTALLAVGVVYCQMHYAVDALAGLVVGGLVVGTGYWREKREKD